MLRAAFGVDAATVAESWEWEQWQAHKQFLDDVWLPAMVRGGGHVLG